MLLCLTCCWSLMLLLFSSLWNVYFFYVSSSLSLFSGWWKVTALISAPVFIRCFPLQACLSNSDCVCILTSTTAQTIIMNKPLAKWNLHGLWLAVSVMLYWCDDYKMLKRLWTRWLGELDQPVWSPLLPSLLSWLFPCGLEIMTSNIWGLVVFEREVGRITLWINVLVSLHHT